MRKEFHAFAAFTLAVASFIPIAAAAERTPISLEQVEKAIRELELRAQKEIADNAVPGLGIAVVFEDKLVYAKGFGVKDTGTGELIDADTVFQLASVSKPIGSTVVAALVGEGKITWDSKISDLDPTFELLDPWVTRVITIRDFYCHRSGLPGHSGDLLEDLGFGREEILHRLRYQHPNTSFRSGYAYTNFGMTEAAVAAAKSTGMEWEVLMEEKLYKPLGMSSTSSRYADFVARPNKALGHVLVDGKWVQKYKRDPDTESPAGGVSSSVNDLAKWLRLQMAEGKFDGKEIVAKAPLAETHLPMMMTGLSPLNLPQFYGLGWNVSYGEDGRHKISHSGAFGLGAGTNVNISLDDNLGVVILSNGSPTGVPEGLAAEFIDLALYGRTTQEWLTIYTGLIGQMNEAEKSTTYSHPPASPTPAGANSAYLGTYTNDFFGDIEVVEKDGGLAVVQGPQKMTFTMKHYDRDIFTYETEGESATGTSGLTFTIGADGKATQVVDDHLDIRGEGTLKRK
jgi:CubicO group peptidase (beta-lactamase class C family)